MIDQISIIIPTLNEEHYLPKLLASIAEQDYTGEIEVIIVEGKSKDKTLAIAKEFKKKIKELQIIIVSVEKRGAAYQRNVGALKAKYSSLLFLDADIILPRNTLRVISKIRNENQYFIDHIVHMPIKFNLFDNLFYLSILLNMSIMQFIEPITGGTFIFTSKAQHKKIGGFNEKAVVNEDLDYGSRSVKSGAKYHLHFYPWVLASPRRLRKEGRIGLALKWWRSYYHLKKYGPISDASSLDYAFGEYDGIKE